jgi:hypothetical protein
VDGLAGREIRWQCTPFDAVVGDVADGINDHAPVMRFRTPTGRTLAGWCREQGLDQVPFGVGAVGGVTT